MAVTLRERPVLRGEDAQRFLSQEREIKEKLAKLTPEAIKESISTTEVSKKVCLKI